MDKFSYAFELVFGFDFQYVDPLIMKKLHEKARNEYTLGSSVMKNWRNLGQVEVIN